MDLNQTVSILLVEDDDCSCELLQSMLELKFPLARIHTAKDGATGLDCVRRFRPNVVVTDINMPEMDGIQLIENIASIKQDICVIVVTAYSDRKNLDRIESTGITFRIIPKPVNFESLFASIKGCLALKPND